MNNIKYIFASRFGLFILTLICLGVACFSPGADRVSPQNAAAENANRLTDQAADRQIQEPARNSVDDPKSPTQTRPRRRAIGFPEGCDFYTIDQSRALERACAAALDDVLKDLPKKSCGYDSFLVRGGASDGSGYRYFIEYATDFHPGAVKFYSLDSNKYLVEVYCSSGAYNVENAYLFYDESALPAKARVLEFPSLEFSYDENSDRAESIKKVTAQTVGGRHFNDQTKELIVFVKTNGTGSAGSYARYSFPNGAPKLLEYRAKFKPEGREYQTEEIIKNPPAWKRYHP